MQNFISKNRQYFYGDNLSLVFLTTALAMIFTDSQFSWRLPGLLF